MSSFLLKIRLRLFLPLGLKAQRVIACDVQIFVPTHFFVQFFSCNPEIRSKYSPPQGANLINFCGHWMYREPTNALFVKSSISLQGSFYGFLGAKNTKRRRRCHIQLIPFEMLAYNSFGRSDDTYYLLRGIASKFFFL